MKKISTLQTKDCCCRGDLPARQVMLTLPIAPRAFCRMRFAAAEALARPILPRGALSWIDENTQQGATIEAVNIEGPGDPLAEMEPTVATMQLIAKSHPHIELRLTTLGIHGEQYSSVLVEHGVSSVTVLVDTVDAETAQKLYAWIRPGKKTVPLKEAAAFLVLEQKKSIQAFKKAGCSVHISATVFPGYNDSQIEHIAKEVAALGAESMSLLAYRPVGKPEDDMPPAPTTDVMHELKKQAEKYLPVSLVEETHDTRIGKDCASLSGTCTTNIAFMPKASKKRPNVAVASLTGMEVDLHLGQAYQFLIYGPREDGLACLLGTRSAPEPGGGDSRWKDLADTLGDCFAVLVTGAGSKPRKILAENGITVLVGEDDIEGKVDLLYGGGQKKKC